MPKSQLNIPSPGDFTGLDGRHRRILLINSQAYILLRNFLCIGKPSQVVRVCDRSARSVVLGLTDDELYQAVCEMEGAIAKHPGLTGPFGVNLFLRGDRRLR